MVILDTDLVTLLGRSDSPAGARLRTRLEANPDTVAVTTIVSYEEQMRGWLAMSSKCRTVAEQIKAYGRLLEHVQLYREIEVLPFDAKAGVEFQRLRALLPRVGTMDLRIAAIAQATGGIVLTRNLRDFALIPGVHADDWSA
jgi:tRNA(fMet)-specific endonuclease VapC